MITAPMTTTTTITTTMSAMASDDEKRKCGDHDELPGGKKDLGLRIARKTSIKSETPLALKLTFFRGSIRSHRSLEAMKVPGVAQFLRW